MLARRLGKRGGLQNLTCFLLLPIVASNINSGYIGMMGSGECGKGELLTLTLSFPSNRKRYNSCRAGKAQLSTSESGGDFSIASTLASKIKNQKSKIDCRAGKAQTSTSESGGDFSSASTLPSKIKNRLMTNNYGIRQILMVRSGLPLIKVLLSLEIATEVTN